MGERRRFRRDAVPASALVRRKMRTIEPPPAVAALASISERWGSIAGDLGAGSVPVGLGRSGILTVACVSAAQAQRLADSSEVLLEHLSDERVSDLRLVVSSAPAQTTDTTAPAPDTPVPEPRPRHRVAARMAAKDVSDPILRRLVERAVATSLAKEDSPAKERKDRSDDQGG